MTIHLSDNIRSLRRARGMTQEALGEALGVSIAVISKWETSASEPELIRVARLADLFDTSVDIPLGYRIQDKRRAGLLDQLYNFAHDKGAAVDFTDLERAAGHFPHDFDVADHLATLYALRCTESYDLHRNMRAIELFEKACALMMPRPIMRPIRSDLSRLRLRRHMTILARRLWIALALLLPSRTVRHCVRCGRSFAVKKLDFSHI